MSLFDDDDDDDDDNDRRRWIIGDTEGFLRNFVVWFPNTV